LKNSLPDFLCRGPVATSWRKFVLGNIDSERAENSRSAG